VSGAVDRLASVAVGLAAIVVAAVVVKREISPKEASQRQVAGFYRAPDPVDNWRSLSSSGVWVGDSTASVVVVEFVDFECPFCRAFHASFKRAQKAMGDSVALLLIHLPIRSHRFAIPAARAAMCAQEQGRFNEYQDALFAAQDSFGLKSWAAYGKTAGVRDTVALSRCARATTPIALVDRGVTVAESLRVDATPTVIINGWRYSIAPTDSLLTILRGQVKAARP
jgi:protein-disulfide isomerase